MTDPTHLSDRMPAVAAQRDTWSPAELAHLAGCAECRSEWVLVRSGHALGEEFRYEPDPDAIADAVAGRLREPVAPVGHRRRWWAAGLAAASVALFLWGGRMHDRLPPAADGGELHSAFAMPELDSLSTGELKDVLDSFDSPLSERRGVGAQGLGDLTDQELERVLRAGGV